MALELNEFPLSDNDADRYKNVKDAEAFDGGLPKFHLQQSKKIQSHNVNGKVTTYALTIHCRNVHQGFMVPFLTRYFESAATKGQFVSHSMQNGQDPLHLKAYHNAIILHNQFLSNTRAIPVIRISPKALQHSIQFGEDAPERLIDVLNRYEYFSSIESTSLSGKIGKYLFITTNEKFEAAKTWITQDLPKIWAELDHNFLDELPTLVQCPRLTTSNLKDASTSRTVAMLNTAHVPDNATIISKWSQPPKIGRCLDLPLGSWLPGSRPFQLARWSAFVHPSSNQLFFSVNLPNEATTFQVDNPMDRRTTHFITYDITHFITYDMTASTEPGLPGHLLPSCAIPVETTPQGALVKISKIRTPRTLPTPTPPPRPDSFKDYCLQRPPWEQQLIAHSRQLSSTISLSDCLTQGDPHLFLHLRRCPSPCRLHRLCDCDRRRNAMGLHWVGTRMERKLY
jgi:hypothetical protein